MKFTAEQCQVFDLYPLRVLFARISLSPQSGSEEDGEANVVYVFSSITHTSVPTPVALGIPTEQFACPTHRSRQAPSSFDGEICRYKG